MGKIKTKKVKLINKNAVSELNKRITVGVKFLDKRFGRKTWFKKVDVSSLNLSSGDTCVCGQLFDEGWRFVNKNGTEMTDTESISRGFSLGEEKERVYYDLLTHLWYCRLISLGNTNF